MILARLLPVVMLSLFVTLQATPAKADVARDGKPADTAPKAGGGAAAIYFERNSETVYIVTGADRRDLKARIADGSVHEALEDMADEFLSDGGEILPENEEVYDFELRAIVDVSGWLVAGVYQNAKGDALVAWAFGAQTKDAAVEALDEYAASKGFPEEVDRDSAYLECDACRVP